MKQNLLIRKFRGLKSVKEKKSLANEDSADIQNFTIRDGLLKTRPGYFKFNNTALSGAITGLYDYKPRWGKFFLMPGNGEIRSETVLNANFVGAPMVGNAPLQVWFFDITLDWDDEITGWHWWFGDGEEDITNDQFPTHTYTTPGLYTVKLEVSTAYATFTKERVNYIRVLDPDAPYLIDNYGGDEEFGVGGMNYLYGTIPEITSVTPNKVAVGYSATDIVVDGLGFAGPDIFIIGEKKCTITDNSYLSTLYATLPVGLPVGVYGGFIRNGGTVGEIPPEAETMQCASYKEDIFEVITGGLFQVQGAGVSTEIYKISTTDGVATLIISFGATVGMASDGSSLWCSKTGELGEYDFSGTLLNTYEYAGGAIQVATDSSLYDSVSSAGTWRAKQYDKTGVYQAQSAGFSTTVTLRMCSDGTSVYAAWQSGTNANIIAFNSSLSSSSTLSLNLTESSRTVYDVCTDDTVLWVLIRRGSAGAWVPRVEQWSTAGVFISGFAIGEASGVGFAYDWIATDGTYVYVSNTLLNNIRQYTYAGVLNNTWDYTDSNLIRSII